ncbi:restriction endonuclease subunit S [Desemzia incerta]|uniref:restriction endonuclease subunit S n=1 Tax=Desemzia incerta TaxID=82801 RepID=UPI0024C3D9C5|nr:restriction endonuclease subunit S [Desemzia incerta]WHZ31462.1 restriction endonuclease subunit S [Desemzia incerta]
MSEKKAPELRFKGFTGDWEQRKLVELSESFEYGLNASAIAYDGENKYLRITDIDDASRKLIQNKLTSPEYDLKKADNYLLQHGDILFTRTGASVGKTYRYDEKDGKVYYAGFLIRARIKSTYNPEFIFQNTLTSKFKNFIRITSQRSGQPGINANEYGSFEIFVPNKEEQSRVASLFKHLDDTIALHQEKLEKLKQLKRAYLQVIFPQKGERTPRLRFADFSSDWKQRKLKEVIERVRGNDGRMNLPTLTISASSGWLDQRERFSGNIAGNEQKNYTLLAKGELSYNHGNSKLAKYGVVFSLRTHKEALVPRVYHSFKTNDKASSDFIEYMFATKNPDRELGKLVSSGARMDGLLNINYEDFSNINIYIPKIEDQNKIADFLRQFDNNIFLHQTKISALQEIKKVYLRQMLA